MKRLILLCGLVGLIGACDSSRSYVVNQVEAELCENGFPPGQCKDKPTKDVDSVVVDSLD